MMTKEQRFIFDWLKGERAAMPEDCDVDICLNLLRRHKILPVAEEMLPCVPEEVQLDWKKHLKEWAAKSLFLAEENRRINARLRSSGIDVLHLKGPVLAWQLFGNYHGRYYVDLDLLVKPDALQEAVEILTEDGYRLTSPESGIGDHRWERHIRFNNDLVLNHPGKGVMLELHFGIGVHGLLSREKEQLLLSETGQLKIGNDTFHLLSPESELVYLCFHAAKHMFFRLSWLRDIRFYLDRPDVDHEKVIALVKRSGLDRSIRLSLMLTAQIFNFKVPDSYSCILEKPEHRVLLRLAQRIIAGPGELTYEQFRKLAGKEGTVEGIDRVERRDLVNQLLYLTLLRKGFRRQAGFLLYQLRKRMFKR